MLMRILKAAGILTCRKSRKKLSDVALGHVLTRNAARLRQDSKGVGDKSRLVAFAAMGTGAR